MIWLGTHSNVYTNLGVTSQKSDKIIFVRTNATRQNYIQNDWLDPPPPEQEAGYFAMSDEPASGVDEKDGAMAQWKGFASWDEIQEVEDCWPVHQPIWIGWRIARCQSKLVLLGLQEDPGIVDNILLFL